MATGRNPVIAERKFMTVKCGKVAGLSQGPSKEMGLLGSFGTCAEQNLKAFFLLSLYRLATGKEWRQGLLQPV